MCVDVYGWVGGYLVVPTLHLPGTFTFTLPILSFLSMMGGLFYLFFYLFFLFSGLFLLGAIFKESPLIILQRKITGKATKFSEVWSWEYITYLPSKFHFVFLVVNTGTLVVTKRRRMRRERKKKRKIFNLLTC